MERQVIALVVLLLALSVPTALAQSQPATPSEPTILVTTSGTSHLYEISRQRATALPGWDPWRAPEPPLSLGGARKAAEAWLGSQSSLIKTFSLTGAGFFRFVADAPLENCGPMGCWYYRLTFAPVAGGLGLLDNVETVVVVLLDGSVVWPRGSTPLAARSVEPASAASTDAGAQAGDSGRSPVPTPDANGVYRLGNGVLSPRPIRIVKPQYTASTMRARIEGTVVLECVVKKDGTVGDVRIAASLHPDLDQEAIRAVRQWSFAPATLRDEPVAAFATCQVEFKVR